MALYEFISSAGIRRDGTELDAPFYADGVWVRFQRGKPRKIGGYRAVSQLANGPVRSVLVDSRNNVNSAHYFSQWGVQRQEFSDSGAGGNLEDRTPLSFTPNANLTWTQSVMYSSTGGTYSAIIAAATPDLDDIGSDLPGNIYAGDISTNAPLAAVEDGSGPILVSGGVCVLQPFLFAYGSNGLIKNSNANDFSAGSGWTGGFSNEANVAGTKFVFGAPVRGGGQSPAGLFWALDALVRVSFVGGTANWAYDTLSQPTSILSKKGIVEVDGRFYWPGTDRFLFYNGVVQELPNQMNSNYFFQGLNYAQRNKVWGTKIPRFGEIWWFYPRGSDTECGDAVIFNYLENTWYDAVKVRSAGDSVQIFPYPVWAGQEDSESTTLLQTGLMLATSAQTLAASATLNFSSTTGVVDGMVVTGDPGIPYGTTILSHTGTTAVMSAAATSTIAASTVLTFTSMTTAFANGDTVTGGTSGATGIAMRVTSTGINVRDVAGTFVLGETITGPNSATAVVQSTPVSQQLDTIYQHEFGQNKVLGQDVSAILSSFTSRNFGYAVGSPFGDVPETKDIQTRISRMEPDFSQEGEMTMYVEGRSYANKPNTVLNSYPFGADDSFVDSRDQARIMRLRFESNVIDGFYQQGQVMCTLSPGDERPTTET